MIARWNDVICSTNRKCYLFRAHIAAQFFVSYGLNIDQIEAILDNDSYKQGKKVNRNIFAANKKTKIHNGNSS